MRANHLLGAEPPGTRSSRRLPGYRPSLLDDTAFWLLGIATGCAVILFFSSIAQFAANADRFVARLQGGPATVRQTNYASASQATNPPGRLYLLQTPVGTSSSDAPSAIRPDSPPRTRSPI